MIEKYVLQKDKYDCGIAALKTIFLCFGKEIKTNTFNNNGGITAYDLIKLSNSNGLIAKGVKTDLSFITKENLPCISHIIKEKSYFHYIVILKNNKNLKTLLVFDPAEGKKQITYDDFKKMTTNVFILFQKKTFKKQKDKRFYNILIFLVKKNKFYIIISIFLSLIFIILSFIFSFYSKVIFIFENYFLKVSILFLLLSLLKNTILFYKNRIIIKINEKIDEEINNKFITHLFNLPYNYYENKSAGYLITTINDVENFKSIVVKIFITLFIDALCIFIIILCVLFINIYYFIFLLVLSFIKIAISYAYSKKYNINYLNFKQSKIKSSSNLVNILENIISVKNLFLENKIISKVKFNERNLSKEKEKFNKINNIYVFINLLLEDFLFVYITILSFLADIKSFSLENIIIFIGIYQLFLTFLNNICNFVVMQKTYISSVKNILDILDETEMKKINCKKNLIDKIQYRNVTKLFNNKVLFKNISFTITKNDFIFIEGKSGVGKTSLLKLLFASDDSFSGEILLIDSNKNQFNKFSLKNNVIYVSNKDNLFIDTIYNNLKIVNENMKCINKAISTCELNGTIDKKNSNYIIDNNLSNSEKSKLLIARAILTNAKYIIFDDCFKELDYKTERRILINLKKHYDITVIFISHRKRNIDLFNKHYKLENKTLKIIKEE